MEEGLTGGYHHRNRNRRWWWAVEEYEGVSTACWILLRQMKIGYIYIYIFIVT